MHTYICIYIYICTHVYAYIIRNLNKRQPAGEVPAGRADLRQGPEQHHRRAGIVEPKKTNTTEHTHESRQIKKQRQQDNHTRMNTET